MDQLPIEIKLKICKSIVKLGDLLALKRVNWTFFRIISSNSDRLVSYEPEETLIRQVKREDDGNELVNHEFYLRLDRKTISLTRSGLIEAMNHVVIGRDEFDLYDIRFDDEMANLLFNFRYALLDSFTLKVASFTANLDLLHALVRRISPWTCFSMGGQFDRSIVTDQLLLNTPNTTTFHIDRCHSSQSNLTACSLLEHAARPDTHTIFDAPNVIVSVREMVQVVEMIVYGGQRVAEITLRDSAFDMHQFFHQLTLAVNRWEHDEQVRITHNLIPYGQGWKVEINVCPIDRALISITVHPKQTEHDDLF